MLQCVAVCCSVLYRARRASKVDMSWLQSIAISVCCSALQCVAVCCSARYRARRASKSDVRGACWLQSRAHTCTGIPCSMTCFAAGASQYAFHSALPSLFGPVCCIVCVMYAHMFAWLHICTSLVVGYEEPSGGGGGRGGVRG